MNPILIIGIVVLGGFIFGEFAQKLKLPRVTGFIIAGVVLNPEICHFIPRNFPEQTSLVTNIALSFITFSIGGSLLYSKIRKLGKNILSMTVCESEFAFFSVVLGFVVVSPFLVKLPGSTGFVALLPFCLLVGSLASATDPAPILAVSHEYKTHGSVTSAIMGVSAFDDVLGIINFSIAVSLAEVLVQHQGFQIVSLLKAVWSITGAILLGFAIGSIFNFITPWMKKDTEGAMIVLILGLLALCFGLAGLVNVDELLSSMTMGAVVTNFNPARERIFRILERYTEDLIFVLFFTLSGMHLNFSVLMHALLLVLFFTIFRTAGKVTGAYTGAVISKAPAPVRKYTAGGLIPLGGIVVGMALMVRNNPAFSACSDLVIGMIIGATVFHELIGPILAKMMLRKAGEIR